jgi:hypothetical protein
MKLVIMKILSTIDLEADGNDWMEAKSDAVYYSDILTGDQFVDHFPWHASVAISSLYGHHESPDGIILAYYTCQRIQEFRRTVLYVRHFNLHAGASTIQAVL